MWKRLLTCAALCTVGMLNGAVLGSATPTVVGILSGIVSSDLGTVWDRVAQRLEGKDTIFDHEDLNKAVGQAIAAVIAKAAKDPQIYIYYQQLLRPLSQYVAHNWLSLSQAAVFKDDRSFEVIKEPYLAQMFSHKPEVVACC